MKGNQLQLVLAALHFTRGQNTKNVSEITSIKRKQRVKRLSKLMGENVHNIKHQPAEDNDFFEDIKLVIPLSELITQKRWQYSYRTYPQKLLF